MEQEIQPQKQNISGNKTILIVIVSVIATALVIGIISYFMFGKSKPDTNSNSAVSTEQQSQATSTNNNQPSENKEADIASDFIKSSYRVIAVLQNKFAPYSLIIATERSEAKCGSKDEPSRCLDDSTCGSIYTSPNCYFFVEPHPVASADPSTRFVGKWRSSLDNLLIDSIKFKDANNIQFSSAGGDGPVGVQAFWNLDLKTGQVTQVSKQEFDSDNK